MKSFLKLSGMIVAIVTSSCGLARSELMAYTFTGTGTGTLGATNFSGAFTITAIADTSAIMSNGGMGNNVYLLTDDVMISVASHTLATVEYETLAIASSSTNGELAFANANYSTNNVILGLAGTDVANYNLQGPFAGSSNTDSPFGDIDYNASILTNQGRFSFSGTPTGVGFFAATVPEPTSIAMLGTGLVGALVLARRRMKKGSIAA